MEAPEPTFPATRRILIVDDDRRIRDMLRGYLQEQGFLVDAVEDGAAMWLRVAEAPPDVVLLDLMLPGEDGLALARALRARSDLGIIMLTGRTDVVERVVGLEVGADDYIAKPFHLREVLARIRSVLRRLRPVAHEEPSSNGSPANRVWFEGWCLDTGKRELTAPDGRAVPITTGDFELLLAFTTHASRVLTRDQLMDFTKGRDWEAFDRSIDAQVSRLRRKLESDPKQPILIKSVRGVGYMFVPAVKADRPLTLDCPAGD